MADKPSAHRRGRAHFLLLEIVNASQLRKIGRGDIYGPKNAIYSQLQQ